MNATLAQNRIRQALDADSRPGLCRFRVFYMVINDRRTIVPVWRLHDTLQRMKLLNLYKTILRLDDGAATELSVAVHKRTLDIAVRAGTWELWHQARTSGPSEMAS